MCETYICVRRPNIKIYIFIITIINLFFKLFDTKDENWIYWLKLYEWELIVTIHNVGVADQSGGTVSRNRSHTQDLVMTGLEHPVTQTGLLGLMSHSCHMEASLIAIFQIVNTVYDDNKPQTMNLHFFPNRTDQIPIYPKYMCPSTEKVKYFYMAAKFQKLGCCSGFRGILEQIGTKKTCLEVKRLCLNVIINHYLENSS